MSKHLYHVAYLASLPRIATGGLRANASTGVGRGAYEGYSKGGIFLSSGGGVDFWYDRMELHAQDRSDDIVKDKLIPVVLRVVAPEKLEDDPAGTRDASHPSFIARTTIPAAQIELWNGAGWRPVSAWKTVEWQKALQGDEDEGYTFVYSHKNPLLPKGLEEATVTGLLKKLDEATD